MIRAARFACIGDEIRDLDMRHVGELIHPIAVEKGTKFSIREGGRTIGAGNVVDIIE